MRTTATRPHAHPQEKTKAGPASRAARRAAAKRRAFRRALKRRAASWRWRAAKSVAVFMLAVSMGELPSTAFAQMGGQLGGAMGQSAMAPAGGGLINRAVVGLQELNANGPGYSYFGFNGADRGLGYIGSYMTVGAFVPYAQDDLGGFWSADLRGHLSVNGGFFSNVGAVRKQFVGGAVLGIGVYWDYDGDMNQYPLTGSDGLTKYGQFGHAYNQVGVSGELLTDWGNIRSNGYIPVGTTGYTAGAKGSPFYRNYVMCEYGLDAALAGADLEVGAYVPGLADWAGMISVGGYALGNSRYDWQQGPYSGEDIVPWFGGVYTRLDMTFLENWDFSLQANNDSYFDWTGFARLTYRMGGSRRRAVPDQMEQPMMRNEHIVRAHQTPEFAVNPDTGAPWRVIHVNNAAGSEGNGTAESPFLTVAAGNAAATNAWDIVLVNRGLSGYTTTFNAATLATTVVVTDPYSDNFVPLAANQYFIGDGSPFFIPTVSCGDINIATATNGTPVLSNPTGTSITLGDGLRTNNFDIINSAVGIGGPGITGDLSSPERGSLATNINIYRAPDYAGPTQGIVIKDAVGAADFRDVNIGKLVTVIGTSGTAVQDWTMTNGSVLVDGGAPDITFTEGTIVNTQGHLLHVNGTLGGEVTLVASPGQPFQETGDGILVESAAGDVTVKNSTPGLTAATIASDKDGIKVVNSSGVQVFDDIKITQAGGAGYAGVNLQGNAGSTSFNNLSITLPDPNTSPGFLAVNDNVVDVTGNSTVAVDNAVAVSMTNVLDANVNFRTVSSTDSPTNGVLLDNVAGVFAVGSSLTVTDSVGDSFVVKNSPNLEVTVPVTSVDSTLGDGIVLQNNAIDATKVSLGQVTVTTAAGSGMIVQNAGVTTAGGSINATGGASLATYNADVDITLATATSTNSTGPGLDLTQTSGAVEIGVTTVTAPVGNGINAVDNLPGFAADFGVTSVSGIDNGAIGVNITNATEPSPATVYSFDSLDITTLNGAGLVTRNGGIVNFNSPATISTAGGAAIDLENTQGTTGGVAGSGFTFLSLQSTDSVSSGVRLNNLNSDLTVTGNTLISGAAGPSLSITDTVSPPATDSILFNTVTITNRLNTGVLVDGIFGQVQVQNLNIDNANNVAGDAVLISDTTNPLDPTGTGSGRVYINGGTISGANGNGVQIQNALAEINGTTITGSLGQGIIATAGTGQETTVEIRNSNISSAAGIDGLRLEASGGGVVNGTLFSTFVDVPGNSLNAIVYDSSSTILLNATGNFSSAAGGAPGVGGFVLNNQAGTLQIDQASTADLSTANNGVTVTAPASPVTFNGLTPPVPPPTP